MLSRLKYFLVLVPFLALTAVPMHADTFLSDNFDSLTPALGVTSAGDFYTVGGTNVDIVGAANGWGWLCAAPESGTCVDLGGTGGDPYGQLVTVLDLAPGTYDLAFDLIGSGRGDDTTTLVTFGTYSQTFTLASDDTTTGIVNVDVVIAGGLTQLEFVDVSGPENIGALLDNVTVSSASDPPPVPEPSSLMLLGTGILVAAGFLRRRITNQ
jgi:hypothetical protein